MHDATAQKLNYFKLLDQPFNNTRDTRFFYESSVHGEALSRLLFLAQDGNMGMGLLTGEIGCGKTMTRTVLHKRLDPRRYKVVSIENCLLEFDYLLLEIISQIKGERIRTSELPDRYSRLAEFKSLLVHEFMGSGRHLVVMLDEAQQLSDTDLEGVKGLTNIASERENFVTMILIGQPELREKVRRLPQVDQRISLRYHLKPLSAAETFRYLEHRMHVAGLEGPPPFTREAVMLICKACRGIPREINRLCKLALDYAIAHERSVVGADIVEMVYRDLRRHEGTFDPGGEVF
ncbi:MAG: hypothetical protein D6678_08170 [Zetaproteobacteria bacterium]|nr:MAG: hypothetical protein D6678_08170 [Zetaproteobacteria bacterium]